MREHKIGHVFVLDGERLCGVVTDRDIVTRAVADELPGQAVVEDVCSKDSVTVQATRNEMPQHDRVDEDRRHCSYGHMRVYQVWMLAVWQRPPGRRLVRVLGRHFGDTGRLPSQ
jgi:CBS domain